MSSPIWIAILILSVLKGITEAANSSDIGVCYGPYGDNYPSPKDIVNLYKTLGITKIRLYFPQSVILDALKGANIDVTLGVRNTDLRYLAVKEIRTETWFNTSVKPYLNDIYFPYLVVGSDAIPGNNASYVLPVMRHLRAILDKNKLYGIKVTTAIPVHALIEYHPPSNGEFSFLTVSDMGKILKFLSQQGAPLFINVYPHRVYASNSFIFPLNYSLFTATLPVVWDRTGLLYDNILDAVIDAFYWAMEKVNVTDVGIVVGESGWPSVWFGDFNPGLAATYNQNFIKRIAKSVGSPKKPDFPIEGFIYAIFNENLQPAGATQHYGLFYPDMTPVYPLVFSPSV